jgi:type IV pilus assembly protein PilY1
VVRLEATEGFKDPPSSEDDNWYFVVGSGAMYHDVRGKGKGKIYVFDLNTMDLAKKFGADDHSYTTGPIAIDANLNYNTDSIYIGLSRQDGDVYVPEIDENIKAWEGIMYRLSTRSSESGWSYKLDPGDWELKKLFKETEWALSGTPTASRDDDGNVWVYFGTGKYFTYLDNLNAATQYFYGIKDSCPFGDCGGEDEVEHIDLYNSTNIKVLTNGEVEGAAATTWPAFVNEVQSYKGWYYSLAADEERVLNQPAILGGGVFFTSFNPNGAICDGGDGDSSLYALYYETGTPYYKPILGSEVYGATRKSIAKVDLDDGKGSAVGLHVGNNTSNVTAFIQQSAGEIETQEVDPPFDIRSGYVGWAQD